jgi:glycosyltransferase involved in cell wall biosynthesis
MEKLSIVIPAYNEEKRISETLDNYVDFFTGKIGENFEIFVVLNGCKDNTIGIVKKHQKKYPEIINYTDIPAAIGKGGALTEGFKKVQGKIIGFTDADGSTSPEMFFKLYKIILNLPNIDCIIGSRNLPESKVKGRTSERKLMTKGFNFGVNFLFKLGINDTQCGAKLIRRNVLKKIIPNLSIANMAFDVNLLVEVKRLGGKTHEVPIEWVDSDESTISKPVKTSIAMALSVIRLRFIYSPLKIFYPILNFVFRPIYEFLLDDHQKANYENWKKENY